jgi:hypothetical protein
MPWRNRAMTARKWLEGFNPDWVSLQFVPFGFQDKGLCFGLGGRLAVMNPGASWHIMFHELWLGLGENSPLKHRLWGWFQRNIIQDLLRRLRPQIVNTQAEPYRKALSREKVVASILPLFSNVPFVKGDGWSELLEPMVAKTIGKRPDRSNLYLAGIFGAVHPEWNAEQAVNIMFPLMQRFQKRLVLVFHGRSNLSHEAFTRLKSTVGERTVVVTTGERSGPEISKILQAVDLGLATTPRQIIEKSGTVAAMLDHGLQVLVTRDDWQLRGTDPQLTENCSRLLSPRQFALLEALPERQHRPPENNSVKQVADQMLAMLKSTPCASKPYLS